MKAPPETSTSSAPRRHRPWYRSRGGTAAVITAVMLVPLALAAGGTYDFTMAQSRRDQISGMADAAALAAVTPAMMLESASQSQAVARKLFSNEIATVSGVSYASTGVNVTATDTTSASTVTRDVTVSYSAVSRNAFASLLGISGFPISGTSTATSTTTPNIDFYVMLDTSPSMEIAATTDGINTMVANTGSQGGCAFGCHETDPAADNLGNPGGEDNYALARALGVTLRIDLVNQAVQNLMTVAQNTENGNGASYRAAIYTMDYSVNQLQTLTSDLSTAQSSAANIASLVVYDNNCLTQANCNDDEDTDIDAALNTINTDMPVPGNGTKNANDSPQEVLFIVSDGVDDTLFTPVTTGTGRHKTQTQIPGAPVTTSGSDRIYGPVNSLGTDYCTAIKNRGIRIAFLYTTYNPLPTNQWYNDYVSPFQSQIATYAQNCASPGLFYEVSTDGDISAALASLFEKAVATARLIK